MVENEFVIFVGAMGASIVIITRLDAGIRQSFRRYPFQLYLLVYGSFFVGMLLFLFTYTFFATGMFLGVFLSFSGAVCSMILRNERAKTRRNSSSGKEV